MILTDLQNATVARLLWDAYFTETGRAVACLAENALDLVAEYTKAVSKLGTCVIVASPAVAAAERVDLAAVSVQLDITEHVIVNRSTSGSCKPACDVGAKCMALLRGWTPNADMWAPFEFQSLQRIGEDEQGMDHWNLACRTYTMLDLLVTLIGTDAIGIGDEDGAGLIVSPTSA